jgi:hypothetical protein
VEAKPESEFSCLVAAMSGQQHGLSEGLSLGEGPLLLLLLRVPRF